VGIWVVLRSCSHLESVLVSLVPAKHLECTLLLPYGILLLHFKGSLQIRKRTDTPALDLEALLYGCASPRSMFIPDILGSTKAGCS
jgi:hypothetical protein